MIDVSRHEEIFHPVRWGRRRVDVIGLGATGSKVAMSLAKLGVQNLHLWDHDTVEDHNLANQIYDREDVGAAKAAALQHHIEAATGTTAHTHGAWTPEHARDVGDVVFMMADTMAVRNEFFQANRMNPRVSLVVDSRLGATHGHILTYRPGKKESLDRYASQLYSDDDAITEVSECGTAITVGPTADIISGYIVWALIRFAGGGEIEPEIAVMAREPGLVEV